MDNEQIRAMMKQQDEEGKERHWKNLYDVHRRAVEEERKRVASIGEAVRELHELWTTDPKEARRRMENFWFPRPHDIWGEQYPGCPESKGVNGIGLLDEVLRPLGYGWQGGDRCTIYLL